MGSVRIGCVRYLNTVPLIEGLHKLVGVELVPAVPSRIVDLLAGREVDVGLVSLVDAARSPAPLALLPVGMIGCDGPTLTVRLFSGVPIERMTRVHADTDSHTSTVLCRVLLDRLHGIRPEVTDFDARERMEVGGGGGDRETRELDEAWPETLLLIGDKVVTDSPPAVRYPYQLDLGEAWRSLTGLPFVYAVWMCRAGEADESRIRTAAAILDRQRRHNLTRLDWIITTRAPEHRWPADLARTYLGQLLRYEVGPRERDAVSRFFEEAARLGLIEMRAPRWVELEEALTAG